MTRAQNTVRSLLSGPARPLREPICLRCRSTTQQRRYASAAVAVADQPHVINPPAPPAESASPNIAYQLRAGVVLSRPPQITRDLTPFEKAYYLYQRRLNERLALPFTKYFYFRADTPAEIDWKRKVKQRQTAARDIGVYNAYGEFGWDDELKVGAAESEPEHQMEALLKDAQTSAASKSGATRADSEEAPSVEMPPSRITEADEKNDQKSLNRALQRTLYLLVQDKEGGWVFPNDILVKRENLHLAAERILVQTGGVNMNTWVVGNVPIGHGRFKYPGKVFSSPDVRDLGEKVFFMKARIMAGQANVADNPFGLNDFRWLTKQEMPQFVTKRYWDAVQNMLPER